MQKVEGSTAASPRPKAARPIDIDVDSSGNIYMTTENIAEITRIRPSGVTQSVAGQDAHKCVPGVNPEEFQECLKDGRPAAQASLGYLEYVRDIYIPPALNALSNSVAVSPTGGIYIAGYPTGVVRFANLTSKTIRIHGMRVQPRTIQTVPRPPVVASGIVRQQVVDGKEGLPLGHRGRSMAADSKGNLFVAGSSLFQVDRTGKITTLLKRDPAELAELDRQRQKRADGTLLVPEVCCNTFDSILLDRQENLYISDLIGGRIWFFNRGSKTIRVHGRKVPSGQLRAIAGNGIPYSAEVVGDGKPALQAPGITGFGMALDAKNNLYVGSVFNGAIRKIDSKGIIMTLAGIGESTFNGDGLSAKRTSFRYISDIEFDRCGNLVVSDNGNYRLRRINLGKC